MKTRALMFVALLIIIPATSFGQLGNFLKKTSSRALNIAGREAEKDVTRKVDSAIMRQTDKAINNIAGSQNEKSQGNQTGEQGTQKQDGSGLGKLFSNKIDLKYNEEYDFTSRLYMETESYDKEKPVKADLLLYFNSNSPDVGIETKSLTEEKGNSTPVSSTIIMDGENKCFLMLTESDGMKMGIISGINEEKMTQTQPQPQPQTQVIPEEKTVEPVTPSNYTPPSFTKTGNTRVIAGYKCDEYIYTNPENKQTGKVWFTKDANLLIDKRGWQKTGLGAYYGDPGFEGGIILATESYDENGKLIMKFETKEIDRNSHYSISVKGYALRELKLNQGFSQK